MPSQNADPRAHAAAGRAGTPAAIPTVADLLDYLGLTSGNIDTDQATEALTSALDVQASLCLVDPYEQSLREAALRRAAAILAGRGAPLGQIDGGPFGATNLIRWDAHIEMLESSYRKGAFA